MNYVGEKPWWPVESPKKAKRRNQMAKRGIRSSLLILYLKDGKLQDSRKQEEGKTFHKSHVAENDENDDLWDNVCGLGSRY